MALTIKIAPQSSHSPIIASWGPIILYKLHLGKILSYDKIYLNTLCFCPIPSVFLAIILFTAGRWHQLNDSLVVLPSRIIMCY